MSLQNSITVLVKQTEDPEIDKFHTAVNGIFNQIAEVSEAKTRREAEEMEEPFYNGGID